MALGETFQSSTVFLKICLILAPLGCLFQIIGVATEYWVFEKYKIQIGSVFGINNFASQTVQVHGGLWGSSDQHVPAWMDAARAFSVLGILSGVATAVLIVACLFVTAVSQSKISHIIGLVADVVTVGCILLGVIIFGANYKPGNYNPNATPGIEVITAKSPHWSFGICVAAAIVFLIAGILLLLNLLKKRQS